MNWKSFAKRVVFLLLSFAYLGYQKLLRHFHLASGKAGGRCVVLYYHEVRTEHRARFAHQMDTLIRYSRPIRTDTKHPLDEGVRYTAVTFDDGFKNAWENALPELEKRKIPCTFFIIAEALGKYPNWLTDRGNIAHRHRVLSEQELTALNPDLVTVGSHTLTHPNLPRLSRQAAETEIAGSRTKLEKILNREVRLFSFPYGAADATLIETCRRTGYERVFTTLPTSSSFEQHDFVVGRVPVEPTDWPLEFRLKLMGAYSWFPKAICLKQRARLLLSRRNSGRSRDFAVQNSPASD